MALSGTHGLFARGDGQTGIGILGFFARGLGLGSATGANNTGNLLLLMLGRER